MTHSPTLLRRPYKIVTAPPSMSVVMPSDVGETAQVKLLVEALLVRRYEPWQREAVIDVLVEDWWVENDRSIFRRPRPSTDFYLLVDGWACRAQTLSDGARQITDILLPGDLFQLPHSSSLDSGQDVRACGPAHVVRLRRDGTATDVGALQSSWEEAREIEARILRSRLVSIGRRRSYERVAYLFAEVHERLKRIGLARGGAFACPMTQEQVGDALGLTAVHVNRVLHKLRDDELVTFNRPNVLISDLARLHAVAGFATRSIAADSKGTM